MQMVRMANLAVVGSHSVNGVAALHTELLKKHLFSDFDAFYPGKFNNKTNGITPAPLAAGLQPAALRPDHLQDRRRLGQEPRRTPQARTMGRRSRLPERVHGGQARQQGRSRRNHPARNAASRSNPDALFDVQIKRLHEYKRQHLNLLHILALYRRILQNPNLDVQPRVFIFAAKAAPGYDLAKCIIKAINAVGGKINNDPRVGDKLKVVFLPELPRLRSPQRIIPGGRSLRADFHRGQGSLRHRQHEARAQRRAHHRHARRRQRRNPRGSRRRTTSSSSASPSMRSRRSGTRAINPYDYYQADEELRAIVDWVGSNYFTPDEPGALGSAQAQPPRRRRSLPLPRRFPLLQRRAGARSTRPTATRPAGRRWRSSTPRAWANSPATAPSTNTPATSGSCRRCRSENPELLEPMISQPSGSRAYIPGRIVESVQ